jgi:hypothetical protein
MANKKLDELSELTTPADGDLLYTEDVSDTTDQPAGTNKKITWTSIKAFLKTYFDTLYSTITNLSDHMSDTTTHGTTGDIVGTTDEQTLTNKTLSAGVKLDANADSNITQYGMSRQAIMNGNFDVWQRGTSAILGDLAKTFVADRWYDYTAKDGGTLPTLTRSRQLHTSGDITNSFYFTRVNTNGAGTSLGVNSEAALYQQIENGVRNLCGLGKKFTVSFWARSDIANKRICPTYIQHYGTGGSPSATEYIQGTPITLTSTWTKYTATFTTNTLVGKTFGTAGDDRIILSMWYMWGATIGNSRVQTSVTAETYVGSGNIDIAQVQLCSGDVALPFQPKSYEEELRACQRYCYGVTTSTANERISNGSMFTTQVAGIMINVPSVMRKIPTITATSTDWQITDGATATDLTDISISADSNKKALLVAATVGTPLTQFRPMVLIGDGTIGRVMIFDAEL